MDSSDFEEEHDNVGDSKGVSDDLPFYYDIPDGDGYFYVEETHC